MQLWSFPFVFTQTCRQHHAIDTDIFPENAFPSSIDPPTLRADLLQPICHGRRTHIVIEGRGFTPGGLTRELR
ncbi:MAG: hypothetical protein KDB22_22290, partial [Planctomycetales bacterium]|nr:hypothetical protein [Planctomycetales bacterium]